MAEWIEFLAANARNQANFRRVRLTNWGIGGSMTWGAASTWGSEQRAELNRLFVRMAQGDTSVMQTAYLTLWPVVLRYTSVALNRADAEDVAQLAIISVWTSIHRYDPERDALGWALTIASFEIKTARRRMRRRRESGLGSILRLQEAALDPEQLLAKRRAELAFREALKALSETDQQVIISVLAPEGRPSCSPDATLRKRKQRALQRLRLALSRLDEAGHELVQSLSGRARAG